MLIIVGVSYQGWSGFVYLCAQWLLIWHGVGQIIQTCLGGFGVLNFVNAPEAKSALDKPRGLAVGRLLKSAAISR
jgi:hypothetical protein